MSMCPVFWVKKISSMGIRTQISAISLDLRFQSGDLGHERQAQLVRRSGLGVVSWTWGRGSIPTPGVYSGAAIPLGKGLTVHYPVFSDET